MSLHTPQLKPVASGVNVHGTRLTPVLVIGRHLQKAQTTNRKLASSIDQSIDSATLRADRSMGCRRPMGSVVLAVLGPSSHKPAAIAANAECLSDQFARLGVDQADTDVNTGKRRIDGSRADSRIGQTISERFANERFHQTMLLVLEYRCEWPNQALLTADDVDLIRMAKNA